MDKDIKHIYKNILKFECEIRYLKNNDNEIKIGMSYYPTRWDYEFILLKK